MPCLATRVLLAVCLSLATLGSAAAIAGCDNESTSGRGPAPPQEAAGRPAPDGASPDSLRGAPRPLAALHREANRLLGGGPRALEDRLAKLRGYPVVVNKWASWCPPCRAEFPFFQRQSVIHGHRVAFLGVDSNDTEADARAFLEQLPVSYPHYKDPSGSVARVVRAVAVFPSTAFVDSKGKLAYLKQGGYASEQKLAEDIGRYAK